MMYETSDPKKHYFIANTVPLFPSDLKVLTKLYQPLVGAMAVSLYQTLIQNYSYDQLLAQTNTLYQLQEMLDCSLEQLFSALHKLEATGLVRTFLSKNIHMELLVFRLQKVPSSSEFFATSLLSSLLREKVGDLTFQTLSQEFAQITKSQQRKIETDQEVSASFFEVFTLPEAEAITPSDEVQQAAIDNQDAKLAPANVADQDQVDWQLMADLFDRNQISPSDLKQYKFELASLMNLYGLSEAEMVDELLPTLKGGHHIDMQAVKRDLLANWRGVHNDQRTQAYFKQPEEKAGLSEAQKSALAKVKGLTEADRAILVEVNRYAPMRYLEHLRAQRGGKVLTNERYIIKDLKDQWGMADNLINLLLHTALVDMDNSTLNRNLVEKTANDWMQNQVVSPVDAFLYMHKRNEQMAHLHTRKRPMKVIEGTDWSKQPVKQETKVDLEKMNRIFKEFSRKKTK